jgi:hypothetical protein
MVEPLLNRANPFAGDLERRIDTRSLRQSQKVVSNSGALSSPALPAGRFDWRRGRAFTLAMLNVNPHATAVDVVDLTCRPPHTLISFARRMAGSWWASSVCRAAKLRESFRAARSRDDAEATSSIRDSNAIGPLNDPTDRYPLPMACRSRLPRTVAPISVTIERRFVSSASIV